MPHVLAVELKENGELIGDTGINEVEGRVNEVEIGYSVCNQYSGNGYATETVFAMTDYVGRTFGIKTLYGRVLTGNIASVKVMEKAGYQYFEEDFDAEDDPYGKGMLIYKKEL